MKETSHNSDLETTLELLSQPHLKENPFTVPEGYFQQIADQWKFEPEQASQTSEATAPKRSFLRLIRPQLQFAAGFLLLFGLGYGLLSLATTSRTSVPETDELSELYDFASRMDVIDVLYHSELSQDVMPDEFDIEDVVDLVNNNYVDLESLIFEEDQ